MVGQERSNYSIREQDKVDGAVEAELEGETSVSPGPASSEPLG